MPSSTVQSIIRSFIRDGHRIVDRRAFNHRIRRLIGGSEEFEAWLLDKDTLQKWAYLSMEARSRKLYREHGVYVHPATLRTFYLRNRVSYTKP